MNSPPTASTTRPPLPDYPSALARVLELLDPAPPPSRFITRPLHQCLGSVLAEDLPADRDLPPFHRAMMDGYALRAADLAPGTTGTTGTPSSPGRALPVIGELPAGAPPNSITVPPGSCIKIATGAALPPELDSVIPHEHSDRANPVTFFIDALTPGNAVHPRAADAQKGDIVLTAGTRLLPHHLAIAAAIGRTTLTIAPPPRTLILTSGDEVQPIDAHPLAPHHIRNSNGPMLTAFLQRIGSIHSHIQHRHLPDQPEPTINAIAAAVHDFDLIITIGGISAGERDYFPLALERAGITLKLAGARIQPGKPIHAGRAPTGAILLGLPGNPVSALITAHLFILPTIQRYTGEIAPSPFRTVTLNQSITPNPHRQAFRPAILEPDADHATIPTWAGSGDLIHTQRTHGFIQLPIQPTPLTPGTQLPFHPWS